MLSSLKKSFLLPLLSLSLICAEQVFAANTSQIIPKGITRSRVVIINTSDISQEYNQDGQLQDITAGLNRSVPYSELLSGSQSLRDLRDSLNATRPGLGDELVSANLFSDFSTQVRMIMPAVEYGLNEKWNIGVRLPVITTTVKNNFRAEVLNNADNVLAELGGAATPSQIDGLNNKVKTIGTQTFVDSVFTSKGYKAPRDFSETNIGDLEFGAKYKIYDGDFYRHSILAGVRAPTGKESPIDDIFDNGTGDGVWGAALEHTGSIMPLRFLEIGTFAKANYFFPSNKNVAIPKDADDSLPSLLPADNQVHLTKFKKGTELETEVSLTGTLPGKHFKVWTAYQHNRKAIDDYSGNTTLFYEGLETSTNYQENAGELGVGFSSIQMFRNKKFPFPMQLELLYNNTFSGVNASKKSYARVDAKFYF